jgi:ectoine hydroxylase-related dioxygenase (phytanoyl-CoA dioxygenase family)
MPATIEHVNTSDSRASVLQILERNGVVIVEGMIEAAILSRINRDLDPMMADAIMTTPELNGLIQSFFGDKTRRIGALPAKSRAFCEIMTHPLLNGLCDDILLKCCASYQLNVGQVLEVGPGAEAQLLHRDEDVWSYVPKPCPTFQVSSMAALVDFTEEMGATRLVPGSHLWKDRSRQAQSHEVAVAEMPAGAMAIYDGGTLHGAGANRTVEQWRRGIHISFVAGWLRTEENNYLGVPPEVACQLPDRVQALLGYEMHDAIESGGGIAGYVELRDPMLLLREKKVAS